MSREVSGASTCRSCGAPILWIKTRAGKFMPCESKQIHYITKPGAAAKIVTPGGDVISAEITGDPAAASGFGYAPHWANCPGADNHRRR